MGGRGVGSAIKLPNLIRFFERTDHACSHNSLPLFFSSSLHSTPLHYTTHTERRALPSQRTTNTNHTLSAMGRNKGNDTPKDASPSPRRIPTPTPPPSNTNEAKGRPPQKSVATRNKKTYIDMNVGTHTESTTVAPTVKNADKQRLSSDDGFSLTPGKARKRNADAVDEDPLFATKHQRKTCDSMFLVKRP